MGMKKTILVYGTNEKAENTLLECLGKLHLTVATNLQSLIGVRKCNSFSVQNYIFESPEKLIYSYSF